MTAFREISTWALIAGVFIVIKGIFNFLSWLFYDKDKALRDAVQQAWDYLSQHNYFEVSKTALARLHDRLAGIFEKRTRFFYLFLFFLLINAASLLLGKYFFGIDPAELKALISSLNEVVPPDKQLTTMDMIGPTMRPAMAVVSVFQLTLLDLFSFLFTMGIIWLACRSRSIILFLIELITDISILGLFLVLIFSLLYYWFLTDLSAVLFGLFIFSLSVGVIIWMSYRAFSYMGHPNPSKVFLLNPLRDVLVGPLAVLLIITLILSRPGTNDLYVHITGIVAIFFIPIILFWLLIIHKMRPTDKGDPAKVFQKIYFFMALSIEIMLLIMHYPFLGKLYELLPSARNSRFVLILVLSSAFPSLAHLFAMAAAIIAKATPKWLQKLINRLIKAIPGNDEKVLRQLGNAFGGLGALITAIIKLF